MGGLGGPLVLGGAGRWDPQAPSADPWYAAITVQGLSSPQAQVSCGGGLLGHQASGTSGPAPVGHSAGPHLEGRGGHMTHLDQLDVGRSALGHIHSPPPARPSPPRIQTASEAPIGLSPSPRGQWSEWLIAVGCLGR